VYPHCGASIPDPFGRVDVPVCDSNGAVQTRHEGVSLCRLPRSARATPNSTASSATTLQAARPVPVVASGHQPSVHSASDQGRPSWIAVAVSTAAASEISLWNSCRQTPRTIGVSRSTGQPWHRSCRRRRILRPHPVGSPSAPSCGCVGICLPWGGGEASSSDTRSVHRVCRAWCGPGAQETGSPLVALGTSRTPPVRYLPPLQGAVRSPGDGWRHPDRLGRPLIRPPVNRALIRVLVRAPVRLVLRAGARACRAADARAGRHTARVDLRAADLEDPEAARRPPRSVHR
jgi:hypothetical protein